MTEVEPAESRTTASSWTLVTRLRPALEVAALAMIVAVCGAMLVVILRGTWIAAPVAPTRQAGVAPARRPDPPTPTEPLSLDGAQIKGTKTAPVAVIEYSDFQCPYCGRFARDTFPTIDRLYVSPGKVLFAFREFPLQSVHPQALSAALAAECAGEQGQFWRMHDLNFADQAHLDESTFEARARSQGLDTERFGKCFSAAGGAVVDRIKADETTGDALAVSGTPTFFLGRIQPDGRVKIALRFSGARPIAEFRSAIDSLLKQSESARTGTR